MAQTAIPVRFDEATTRFLTTEAARNGVNRSEYIRTLVARGLLAQSLEDSVAEIKQVAAGGGITREGFRVLLTALMETRNLVQAVAVDHHPGALATAEQRAKVEVDRLLGCDDVEAR